MFDKIFKKRPQDQYAVPQVPRDSISTNEHEKGPSDLVDTPIPLLTWRSFIMCILVSMGGFLFGYDTGQISGFLEMKDFLHRYGQPNSDGTYHFSNVRSGVIVALLSIGTLMGALVAAPIADRLGRKWSISWWSLMVCIGITIQISSPSGKWYQVAMGRWVAGLGVGAISLLVPMYQAESGPRHIRGSLISTYQLFITLGIFVANCINFGTESRTDTGSWRIPMGVTYIWAIILGFGMMFFPESPRYDYRNGKMDKAKKTLAKIYGIPHNHRALLLEFDEIRQKYEEEKRNGKVSWIQMFRAPTMGYRVAVGVALQALQQLTGANYFFYYGTTIFNGAGIKNSYVTQMILGGVNFGTTFLGLYLIEHYGRRRSLIAGALWMFVCFMVFASVGHFSLDREDPERTKSAGVVMVVFACLFILGFASTWGPMVWSIIAELYPSQYRARAMSLATASNWLWNFLLAFFTPFITGDIDFRFGYVFAGCLFFAAALVYFAVIEGQGRTLEEIDTMYRMGVKPWKSSKFQFPDNPDLTRDSLNKDENTPGSAHIADPHTELREDGSWMPETRAQS
ncbi:Major facilitator superfamily domain general substrate transporter [Penicillium cf. griseofulvum]|uniref:Major facilitator superfamily domain general substrate transporter n=1 Tax=Penicillium cf. griseofulvum TaxID=2972120 RepID=A0A9W9J4N1_9EURO|nr:Major facilitator superfamily domain general substrate transporter [Penicillium cf. griseofulvum]KAJ5433994.1 Major facilitator superfamily domain general substrate transporter [Penicillium cf. griseofulvum]